MEYPAPGDPALAARVAELAHPTWVGLDHDSWGIDHGAWSVLVHLFPGADVPVVQLSINADQALRLPPGPGRSAWRPLRDEGVLVLASGNVVHNLRRMDWGRPDSGTEWARRFDEAARQAMATDPPSVAGLGAHPDFRAAVPTPEHFIPLLYLAGLARAAGAPADTLLEGCAYGSLSMTSYTLGYAG